MQYGRSRKATPHASVPPSVRDLAWAAGIFEGEGNAHRARGRTGASEMVEVTQKDPWLLYRLQAFFGGTVSPVRHLYRWRVSGMRARGVLQTLYPMLSPRRQAQAVRAMALNT